jgi:hypothetical protein
MQTPWLDMTLFRIQQMLQMEEAGILMPAIQAMVAVVPAQVGMAHTLQELSVQFQTHQVSLVLRRAQLCNTSEF